MKNLILSSLLILLMSGCSFNVFNGYHKTEKRIPTDKELNSIFSSDTNAIIFQTSINVLKNHFSGLMIIKPLPDQCYRVIFLTEVGIKLFDMEFVSITKKSEDGFKLHYCMDALNRKPIIKMLKNDIGLLLMNNLQKQEECKVLQDKNHQYSILKIKNKCKKQYYFYTKNTYQLSQIIQTKGLIKKVSILFYQSTNNFPDSIYISHYNIKFNMKLNPLIKN